MAGLGFGTGFSAKRLPKALIDEAEARGMPLFEVPYEMPFIAITEYAFGKLVNDQYDVLQRAGEVHERLERLVLQGKGLQQVLESIAGAAGGSAMVLDAGGAELARHPKAEGPPDGAHRHDRGGGGRARRRRAGRLSSPRRPPS